MSLNSSPRASSIPRFALRRDEAAASVAVSPSKFDEWVRDGRMPKPCKIDGVVFWSVEEVREAWERLRDGQSTKSSPFDGFTA